MGVMVWGERSLCLSVGRNGFWDRRGGVAFASRIDFRELRQRLDAGEEAAVKEAFAHAKDGPPYRTPTQLPGGRLEVVLSAPLARAELDMARGALTIGLRDGCRIEVIHSMDDDVVWLGGVIVDVRLLPAWHWIGELLAGGGVTPPETWSGEDCGGFVQSLPKDARLGVAWQRHADGILLATALGEDPRPSLERCLSQASEDAVRESAGKFWVAYRARTPRVSLPDPALQRHWEYGLWKQGCLTPPDGVPASLQGPWMAEHELPLWSNDYHFNINLQMIYWPALATNCPGHFRPLWRMLQSWLPALQSNASRFFGNAAALMLPHAVDDHCQVIGNFWQGTVDQACTAWMAQLAWLHYRYSREEAVLREVAWPLLVGAFEGFWSMMEEDATGTLSLPISVSAEFPGWGRNASFQLAACHMLAHTLPQAASILGHPPDVRWEQVANRLPRSAAMPLARVYGENEPRPRIVLWEGKDLPESHRHHSHLAAIWPFCQYDALDEGDRDLVRRSIEHWVAMGPGQWVGWSLPWAAAIWARCLCASAAVSLLRIWEDVYTNEGGGTLHNADSPGHTGWIHGPFFDWPDTTRKDDQMQLDAGFGFLQAIVEIFVQQRGYLLHVLPSIPKQWADFEFDGVLVEGGFLVGATVRGGRVDSIRLASPHGGLLRLEHGLGDCAVLDGEPLPPGILERMTQPGQSITLHRRS
jgi:hypothetical protein